MLYQYPSSVKHPNPHCCTLSSPISWHERDVPLVGWTFTPGHTAGRCLRPRARGRAARWTWSRLCASAAASCHRRSSRSEFLLYNPGTLRLWRTGTSALGSPRRCVWNTRCSCLSLNSRTCRCSRTHTRDNNLIFRGLCTLLLLQPTLRTPPPSNSVLTGPLCTAPGRGGRTCLGVQGTTGPSLWALPFCCSQTEPALCTLCSGPGSGDGNLERRARSRGHMTRPSFIHNVQDSI